MKVNESLQRFGSAIKGLVSTGIALTLLGLLAVAMNNGYYGNPGWLAFGSLLIYLGSGFIGLGVFGAFLKITAKAIIEGLGGSIGESPYTSIRPPFLAEASTAELDQDLSEWLTPPQRQLWIAAGSPDLRPWIDAGRPNLRKWLSDLS